MYQGVPGRNKKTQARATTNGSGAGGASGGGTGGVSGRAGGGAGGATRGSRVSYDLADVGDDEVHSPYDEADKLLDQVDDQIGQTKGQESCKLQATTLRLP